MNIRDLISWLESVPNGDNVTYKERASQVTLIVTDDDGEEYESDTIEAKD